MSLCVVDGGHCCCNPQDGIPCPGVVELRKQIEAGGTYADQLRKGLEGIRDYHKNQAWLWREPSAHLTDVDPAGMADLHDGYWSFVDDLLAKAERPQLSKADQPVILSEWQKLVAALQFYSDEGNYRWDGVPMTPYVDGKPDPTRELKDRGQRARTRCVCVGVVRIDPREQRGGEMNPDLRAVFEHYQREQSKSGYTFVPGDEHIFRDAWNLAIKAAIGRIIPSASGRGIADFYIREIQALTSPLSDVTNERPAQVNEK